MQRRDSLLKGQARGAARRRAPKRGIACPNCSGIGLQTMKRIFFFLAAFVLVFGLQSLFAADRPIVNSTLLFASEEARDLASRIDLGSGEHISLSLGQPAEMDRIFAQREDQNIEAVEGRARRGAEDTAPILEDPQPAFQAKSIAALTTTTAFPQANPGGPADVAALNAGPSWTAIGPAPIPNGQTDPANANGISQTQSPVSGRTTAIAVDPTNSNIAYVGTAQGGLYRTLNGGASWTPLLDNALALAVGSVKIDPKDRTKVLVGTGEGNFSGDSYVGVGVYMITNADSAAPVLNGPYNLDTGGKDVMTRRCAVSIAIASNNDNKVYVRTVTSVAERYGCVHGTLAVSV